MDNKQPSIWDAAFPPASAPVINQSPDVAPPSQYSPVPRPSPPADYYVPAPQYPTALPAQRWEPLPGKKLTIGALLGIAVGIAQGLGYDTGIQMTPGEGWMLAWGGLMGVFADMRLKKFTAAGVLK